MARESEERQQSGGEPCPYYVQECDRGHSHGSWFCEESKQDRHDDGDPEVIQEYAADYTPQRS